MVVVVASVVVASVVGVVVVVTSHRTEGPSSTQVKPSSHVPTTHSLTLSAGRQRTTGGKSSVLIRSLHAIPSSQLTSLQVMGRSTSSTIRMQRVLRYWRQTGWSSGHVGGTTISMHCRFSPHSGSLVSHVMVSHLSVTFWPLQKKLAVQSPWQKFGVHVALKNLLHSWSWQGSTSHSVTSSGQFCALASCEHSTSSTSEVARRVFILSCSSVVH